MKPLSLALLTYNTSSWPLGSQGHRVWTKRQTPSSGPAGDIVRASEVPSGPFVSGWMKVTLLSEQGLAGSASSASCHPAPDLSAHQLAEARAQAAGPTQLRPPASHNIFVMKLGKDRRVLSVTPESCSGE